MPFSDLEAQPHDVYVYFDNDAKVRAPVDALALERRLARVEIPEPPTSTPDVQAPQTA
jgi:uncharacterized protein YecE (DUF72 family)